MMGETNGNTNAEKLDALEFLCRKREHGKRYIWEVGEGDEAVRLEDVPLDGHDAPVTFFTEFNPDVPAEVRDAFTGQMQQMHESRELEIGAKEIRAVRVSMAPTQALKELALGGGIVDGVWPKRGEGDNIHAEGLPKSDKAKAELLSTLDTPAIYMLLAQAVDAVVQEMPGDDEPSPTAEVVDDAGESLTSADGN